jgi:hypothetical protein
MLAAYHQRAGVEMGRPAAVLRWPQCALAGLLDAWKNPLTTWLQNFSIITVATSAALIAIHDRMPGGVTPFPSVHGRDAPRAVAEDGVERRGIPSVGCGVAA